MTSESHQQQQFLGWEGEEGDADFMSEFFGSLAPDFSNSGRLVVPTSDAALIAQDITALSVGVGLEMDNGKGGDFNVDEVGSSVNKFDEAKLKGASTSGTKHEVNGGSCESQQKRKRIRTTEMHNMSERKRRDKIKGKLKALQELVPNSHKLDQASLLDETVAYLKALQMHVNALQMQVQLLTGYSPYPSFHPLSQQAVQFSMVGHQKVEPSSLEAVPVEDHGGCEPNAAERSSSSSQNVRQSMWIWLISFRNQQRLYSFSGANYLQRWSWLWWLLSENVNM